MTFVRFIEIYPLSNLFDECVTHVTSTFFSYSYRLHFTSPKILYDNSPFSFHFSDRLRFHIPQKGFSFPFFFSRRRVDMFFFTFFPFSLLLLRLINSPTHPCLTFLFSFPFPIFPILFHCKESRMRLSIISKCVSLFTF